MEKNLGKTAKDKISGFEGIITARCEYLYGITRVLLTGKCVEHKKPEEYWVDESQIELIENNHPEK